MGGSLRLRTGKEVLRLEQNFPLPSDSEKCRLMLGWHLAIGTAAFPRVCPTVNARGREAEHLADDTSATTHPDDDFSGVFHACDHTCVFRIIASLSVRKSPLAADLASTIVRP